MYNLICPFKVYIDEVYVHQSLNYMSDVRGGPTYKFHFDGLKTLKKATCTTMSRGKGWD